MGRQILGILSALMLLSMSIPGSADAAGKRFNRVKPCRAISSLGGIGGQANHLLARNESRWYHLRGKCGVPSDASAVAVNVTMVGANGEPTDHSGYLTVFDAGLAQPGVSTLNFRPGQHAVANSAIIPFKSNKTQVKVFAAYASDNATGVHVIVDVFGYFK